MLISTTKAVTPTAFNFTELSDKQRLLATIITANQQIKHSEAEQVLLSFATRLNHTTAALLAMMDDHFSTIVGQWRTAYESAVMFRLLTAIYNYDHDEQLFRRIIRRYIDLGLLQQQHLFHNIPTGTIKQILNRYHRAGELPLDSDNDWASPLFTLRELKRMSRKMHPSFQDLVYRTRSVNSRLANLTDTYHLVSSIIHVSPSTDAVLAQLHPVDVQLATDIVITEFLKDYLTYVLQFAAAEGLSRHPLIQLTQQYLTAIK